MSNTIYLKRGQNINLVAQFIDDAGALIVLDDTWVVTSSIKPDNTCGELIDFAPVIESDGTVTIERATDDLASSLYVSDIIANDGNDREISGVFYINLSSTITPLT